MADPACQWGEEDSISILCSVLVDKHCRQVVEYFRSADTEVASLEELAEYAVSHNDSSTDRGRKAVQFHHATLPKLADADVIEYDPQMQDVRYAGHDGLESLLDQI